ncbi:MAG: histidine kinase [Rhodothermales bacterium]
MSARKQTVGIGVLIVVVMLMTLLPLGRLLRDRILYADLVTDVGARPLFRGFDWVNWDDVDGQITAVYVFPRGTGHEVGIRQGDILYEFDYSQYFNSEALKRVIESVPPGTKRTYTVSRGDEMLSMEVPFSRYPTFLYPLGQGLWSASIWGFVGGGFLHLLALIIITPLAFRSRAAFKSFLLIAASSIWVFGNLGRILLLTWFGPPDLVMNVYPQLFAILTMVSLIGWIGFPVLLARKVIGDVRQLGKHAKWMGAVLLIPPALLILAAVLSVTANDLIAPVTLESLIAPILFYVCCYVALAAVLNLVPRETTAAEPNPAEESGPWSLAGTIIVLLAGLLGALSVYGVVPIFGIITDETAGWIVIGAQLLSVAPVLLVSFATLKYGKIDQVLSRALVYVAVLGLFFFIFVGGLTTISPVLRRFDAPGSVIAGIFAVILLLLFERAWRLIGPYATNFFRTDRQKARQELGRFVERMRSIIEVRELASESVTNVCDSLGASFASLYLRGPEGFIKASHEPAARAPSEADIEEVWPHFDAHRRVWARNPELNYSDLPRSVANRLIAESSAIVVPLSDEEELQGLLILGTKRNYRDVYTLEDVDIIRSLCSHLALAVERLKLVERERELIRTTAESQLAALRAQINPHFLFNTLNAIAALIEEKPEEAEKTVEGLSAIFRLTLEAGGRPFVSLGKEMSLVRHYLAIEKVRFGKRLRVEHEVDKLLDQTPIPAFSIQTFVENAVNHGISKSREGGTIRLEAHRSDGVVEILVSDTGSGIASLFGRGEVPASEVDFFGIGLQNVSSRLIRLYDRDDLLYLASDPEMGTTVRMLIPIEAKSLKTNGDSVLSETEEV